MACWRIANEWLLKGKRICRPITWDKNSYWYKGESGIIMYSDGTTAEVHVNQIRADDWEIWEEDKTLSYYSTMVNDKCGLFYPEPEVKKTIQNLKKQFDDWEVDWEVQKRVLNKIFGSKLIGGIKW